MSVMEMAAKTKFADLTFEQKLDRLAEVAVKVGLGLRTGQELIMSAPLEALPLVRRITEHAYKVGALLVTTFYSDDPTVLALLLVFEAERPGLRSQGQTRHSWLNKTRRR
jgi:aminopeptidase